MDNQANINQCPPGGDTTIAALAKLLNKPIVELNKDHGEHEPKVTALIREEACIGCKLCIKACPVDCIVGAGKLMHTVIANECTGCKLCIPVCPTDCIDLLEPKTNENKNENKDEQLPDDIPSPWPEFTEAQVSRARIQTEQKLMRIEKFERNRKAQQKITERNQLQQEIREALNRKASKKTKTNFSSKP